MSHLLLVISSSLNVFLFTVQDRMFRADLLMVLSLPKNRNVMDYDDDDTEEAAMDSLVEKNICDSQDKITDNHSVVQQ